jgi:hypothetical protein
MTEKLLIVQREAKNALAPNVHDQMRGRGLRATKGSNIDLNEKLFEALHNRGIIEEAGKCGF